MDSADPLAALRDIHLPPPPDGLSPWPVLAAIAAAVLVVVLASALLLRTRRRWAAELTLQLGTLDGASPQTSLTEAAQLLRRTAILKLGSKAAQLQGDAWLTALDGLFRTRFFTTGGGRIFGSALYTPQLASADAAPVLGELKRLSRRREFLP